MLSQGIVLCQTMRCEICGHLMTAKSNRQLTYLDSNVKTGAEMSAEERIQVALTMGICPICGHSLTEEEFKDVSEAAAAFYASQH